MAARLISLDVAVVALSSGSFNLLVRGHEGSLVLSMDRWRAGGVDGNVVRFDAVDPPGETPPPREIPLDDIEEITWDRLPKQQKRSQVRFRLRNGDLLTFSGQIDETALLDH